MGFRVAVVGATGNVGREILTTLAERDFPADDVVALASSRSIGREVSFGEDDILKVQGLDTYDFRGIDIVLSSPGAKVSEAFAPRAASCMVLPPGAAHRSITVRFATSPNRCAGSVAALAGTFLLDALFPHRSGLPTIVESERLA